LATFDMQFATQMLQGDWNELIGSLLIVGGLAMAAWTLVGGHSGSRLPPALSWPRRGPAHEAGPGYAQIAAGSEWQRMADIVESGIARSELLVDLQARAIDEVEAAEAAVSRLLAECATALMPPEAATLPQERGREREPTVAPVARPLAA
jgi:hypothetical protein